MNALQSNVRLTLYLLGGSIVLVSAVARLILPDEVVEWPATHFSTALAVTSLIIAQLDKARSIYWLLGALGVVALAMVWPSADPLHKMSGLTATSLVLLSLGYAASGVGKARVSRRFWLAAVAFPLFALIGYALARAEFYGAMAPFTALGLLLMGYAGLIAPMQVSGPMHHLFSMALRAAAVAVLIPVVLVLVIDTQAPLGHIATSLAAVISLATIAGHYAALRWAERFQYQAWVQQRERNQLERHASRDELTQAFNRRHFLAMANPLLDAADRYKQSVSALFIDVDHFKRINDTQGHDMGDAALVWLAGALGEQLRSSDLLTRFGGEEFVVLLPNTTLHSAMLSADKLRRYIELNSPASGVDHGFTISLGCVTREPRESLAAMIKRADEACYSAKRRGRNRIVTLPSRIEAPHRNTEVS